MSRKGKGKGRLKGQQVALLESDNEGDIPDPTSNEYFYDDVDEFHASREKILLERGVQKEEAAVDSSEEEEILALETDSDDDEIMKLTKSHLRRLNRLKRKEMDSDIEDAENEEAGLPDSKAWGGSKRRFIGGDVEDDEIDLSGSESGEEGVAKLEEIEALNLQRKMAEQLDDQDFGLEALQPSKKSKDEKGAEKIIKDLSKLSTKEKLQLLKKKSPELLPLIHDFTEKLTEVKTVLQPLYTLLLEKNVQGKAADYVITKLQLSLNYCVNIAFYLMLQAKHTPVINHPVIKRLVQYRNLLKELEPVDQKLKSEVDQILEKLKNREDVHFTTSEIPQAKNTFIRRKMVTTSRNNGTDKRKLSELVTDDSDDLSDEDVESFLPPTGGGSKRMKKQLKEEGKYETRDEKAALAYYQMMKEGRKNDIEKEDMDTLKSKGDDGQEEKEVGEEEEDFAEEDGEADSKRAITYQIAKNKGLTAKKRKELRNPRVKHKMKYRKAKIRRKGQIREPRTETARYGGELSGIRAGIKRGIKLK
ncbi:hypothetical protein CHS0354_039030 [Potamilus streckersoni]|uniref:Sas10 C-terminal domain-containing protein n=1 Tax=Potamilus streckersoni TaxID=2493646 RepID=A0AAE0SQZ1_9BIVA|nr:hypothetical protein CHS0354_039030 [Potamilus streckersoni]